MLKEFTSFVNTIKKLKINFLYLINNYKLKFKYLKINLT